MAAQNSHHSSSRLSFAAALLVISSFLLLSSSAGAQTAQERATRVDQELALEKEVKRTQKTCQKTFQASFDWKRAPLKNWEGYSLASYCAEVLSQLRRFCKGERQRAYLQKHIRQISCRVRPAKSGARLWVKDGVVFYAIDVKQKNAANFVQRELMKKL